MLRMDYGKFITNVLPTLITAFVSTIAMITSYKASKMHRNSLMTIM